MDSKKDLQSSSFVLQMGVNKKIFHSSEILYFLSENHKTFLVTHKDRWAYDKPLRDIEKILPNLGFIRIHRNAIINLNFVKRFTNRNPLSVTMVDGQTLTVSRSRRQEALQRYDAHITDKHSVARKIYSNSSQQVNYSSERIWTLRENSVRRSIEKNPDLPLEVRKKLLLLAQQPQAIWLGEWNTDIFSELDRPIKQSRHSGGIPVFVIYRLFLRDETYDREIDLEFIEEYLVWIRAIANVIGSSKAMLVFEPNALASLAENKNKDQVNLIISLIRSSVEILKQCSNVKLYLDAGHPNWLDAAHISIFLARAGIEFADGFALNVSNYVSNQENTKYGETISNYLGGKHFVIDTSRNGQNSPSGAEEWCNNPQASIGVYPTLDVAHPLIDGYLWIKPPGESDGEEGANDVPDGEFCPSLAVKLIDNCRSNSAANTSPQ